MSLQATNGNKSLEKKSSLLIHGISDLLGTRKNGKSEDLQSEGHLKEQSVRYSRSSSINTMFVHQRAEEEAWSGTGNKVNNTINCRQKTTGACR